MNKDEEHLNRLSIFHYVVAGIAALFGCIFLSHLAIGIATLTGALKTDSGSEGSPAFAGVIFIVIGSVMIIAGWSLAICLLVAARRLARRTHYRFCLVVAGISCVFMPFGTALGVFTIIILTRESVKKLFENSSRSVS